MKKYLSMMSFTTLFGGFIFAIYSRQQIVAIAILFVMGLGAAAILKELDKKEDKDDKQR